MTNISARRDRWAPGALWRGACTVASILIVETIVCGSAVLPVVLIWRQLAQWASPDRLDHAIVFSLLLALIIWRPYGILGQPRVQKV